MAKDIAFSTEGSARKRIKAHLRESELRNLVSENQVRFQQLLAIGNYRAEELRAKLEQREVNEEAALSYFEPSPWNWDSEGWRSQVHIAFLWIWRTRDGVFRNRFVFTRLDNAFTHGLPRPADLCETDSELFHQLLEIAALETSLRKAPCKYLGVHLGKGKYEQNPAKWLLRCYHDAETHAMVHFEWEHVLCEGVRHSSAISVHNLIHHRRGVPGNPLRSSSWSNLTFRIDFMHAVASNVD